MIQERSSPDNIIQWGIGFESCRFNYHLTSSGECHTMCYTAVEAHHVYASMNQHSDIPVCMHKSAGWATDHRRVIEKARDEQWSIRPVPLGSIWYLPSDQTATVSRPATPPPPRRHRENVRDLHAKIMQQGLRSWLSQSCTCSLNHYYLLTTACMRTSWTMS